MREKKKSGLRVATLNVRTLNSTGAVTLLERELSRYNVDIAGLQEIRWLGSGEVKVGRSTVLWSGREDSLHYEGAALLVNRHWHDCCTLWQPVNERILRARFKHAHGFLSVIVAYAPTETAASNVKEDFYSKLDDTLSQCSSNDLIVCLGDFNAVYYQAPCCAK